MFKSCFWFKAWGTLQFPNCKETKWKSRKAFIVCFLFFWPFPVVLRVYSCLYDQISFLIVLGELCSARD